jgi:signal transduction histidine kinase
MKLSVSSKFTLNSNTCYKMNMVTRLIILLFLLNIQSVSAKDSKPDSLFHVFEKTHNYSEKIDVAHAMHYEVYNFYRNTDNYGVMIQVWTELESTAKINRDTQSLAFIFKKKGEIYSIEKPDSGIFYSKKALEYYTLLNDSANISEAYLELCTTNLRLYHFQTAINYVFKSIEISEAIGNKALLKRGYFQLGRIYMDRNTDPRKALEYIRMSEEDKISLSHIGFYAQLHIQIGNIDSAAYYLKIAETLLTNPLIFQRAYYYRALALYYRETNEADSASKYFLLTIQDLNEVQQEHNAAQCYIYLGAIAMKKLNYAEAIKFYKNAEYHAIRFNREFLLPEIYINLSDIFLKKGYINEAQNEIEKYKSAKEKLEKAAAMDYLVSKELQYLFSLKEQKITEERIKKEYEMKEILNQKRRNRIYLISGAAGIFLFISYGFYDFRKRKRLEKFQALANERLRISRDLHDDLGASLSSISVFSSAAKQKIKANDMKEAEKLLDKMSLYSQEMVSGMSEMVWTINPDNDTIEMLANRLQSYGTETGSAKNIIFRLTVDEIMKSQKLSMKHRKNIYLIIKEAINNSVKYSNATEMNLSFSGNSNLIYVKFCDNGMGFNILEHMAAKKISGNGLKNMKQRADEIDGDIEIKSAINNGTTITFHCNIPKNGEID